MVLLLFMVLLHGAAPMVLLQWCCLMVLLHGAASWCCFMVLLHGAASWCCSMVLLATLWGEGESGVGGGQVTWRRPARKQCEAEEQGR